MKMSFLADVLTEETFYDNLTLGFIKVLENTPEVENLVLEKRQPCERMQLSSWEQRHSCCLPTDLRQFFMSTDGFKLTWSYRYAGVGVDVIEEGISGDLLPIGNMKINVVGELKRLTGVKIQGEGDSSISLLETDMTSQIHRPHFGTKCKIFELDACQGYGRVCLVYIDRLENDTEKKESPNPKIWFLDRSFEWHFLADTFTQYFRMMLVHQGLLQWQFRFTPMGLTPFAEQMMSLIAPHNLQDASSNDTTDHPPNYIDPNVFKNSKGKPTKKKV